MRRVVLAFPLSAVLLAVHGCGTSSLPPDPAENLVRVRVRLRTLSPTVRIEIGGVRLATALLDRPAPTLVRTLVSGQQVRLSMLSPGDMDVELAVVLAGVGIQAHPTLVVGDLAASASIEIWNENLPSRPVLAAEATLPGDGEVVLRAHDLRTGGPLRIDGPRAPLVLAHFYPWYTRSSWDSPEMLDRPFARYSTDDPADMAALARQARDAGLDGLIVSWQGRDFEDGWNHRRMLLMLDATAGAGISVSTLPETTVANAPHRQDGVPVEPAVVQAWLADILDLYATHPAYLRAQGRPVVFVYSAARLSPAQWTDVVAGLGGRQVMLVAESNRSSLLDGPFIGELEYAVNRLAMADVEDYVTHGGLRVRTHHLVRGGSRRLWAATVSPGYDDTLLTDGRVPRRTERARGAYYDATWRAAVEGRADWVLVTSWNEWWETTGIEPSEREGDFYVRLTRAWADHLRRVRQ